MLLIIKCLTLHSIIIPDTDTQNCLSDKTVGRYYLNFLRNYKSAMENNFLENKNYRVECLSPVVQFITLLVR